MASYTSSQSGNWNNSSTWGGSGIPGSGDTATVASPNVVTIPDGYTATVGTTSGTTGTVALTVSSGGSLVIGSQSTYSGAALYLQGDLMCYGTSQMLTLYGGAQIRFVPASGQRIRVSFATASVGCKGAINGLSTARCSVLTDPTALANGGLTGYITLSSASAVGLYSIAYCDFTEISDGGTTAGLYVASEYSNGPNISITNCTFAGCARLYVVVSSYPEPTVTISNCNFGYTYAGAASPCTAISGSVVDVVVNASTTGCYFTNNYVYGEFACNYANGWTFDGSIFQANGSSGTLSLNGAGGPWTSMGSTSPCMLVGGTTASTSFLTVYGTAQDCYFSSQAGGYNHYTEQPVQMDCEVLNCVFDGSLVQTTQDGEGFVTETPTGDYTYTLRGNITVPDRQGTSAFGVVICNYTGAETSGQVVGTIEHNTAIVGAKALFLGPENAAGNAGALASLRANIAYDTAVNAPVVGFNALFMQDYNSTTGTGCVTNIGTPADLNYNCSYNLALTYTAHGNSWFTNQGNSYCGAFSPSTPGANDLVNTNPQFVDPGRNMGKWWRSIPGNVTGGTDQADAQSAMGQLALLNTSIYNSTYTVAALLAYVRAGYRPTNAAFVAASYPGDTSSADAAGNSWPGGAPGIGAMAYLSTFRPWIFGDQIESNGGG